MRGVLGSTMMTAILVCQCAFSQDEPSLSTKPDVVLLVMPQGNGSEVVTWTYAFKADRETVDRQAKAMGDRAGATLTNVKSQERTLANNPKPTDFLTVVEAQASGLIDTTAGTVWLDPILAAFAEYDTLRIIVLPAATVAYAGPLQFDSDSLSMRSTIQPGAWEFFIRLKSHDPPALTIPKLAPKEPPPIPVQQTQPSPYLWVGIFASFVVATAVSIAVYATMRRKLHSNAIAAKPEKSR